MSLLKKRKGSKAADMDCIDVEMLKTEGISITDFGVVPEDRKGTCIASKQRNRTRDECG